MGSALEKGMLRCALHDSGAEGMYRSLALLLSFRACEESHGWCTGEGGCFATLCMAVWQGDAHCVLHDSVAEGIHRALALLLSFRACEESHGWCIGEGEASAALCMTN